MKQRILAFIQRPFVRNVTTVASGTAAAQVIIMIFSPIITRLYGPEVFGLQAIFISVVNVLLVFAALGYPTAIVLPRRDHDAIGLIRLSILIAVAVCFFTTFILNLFGSAILRFFNAEAIAGFLYLIPVAMFISVLAATLSQWLIRNKSYGLSARYTAVGMFLTNIIKAAIGLFHPVAFMLIASNIFGSLLGTLLMWRGWRRTHCEWQKSDLDEGQIQNISLLDLAKQYSDFPLLRTPQNLINAFSQSLPILMLSIFFGAAKAGQYAIALAVLAVPANLIGGSVMSIFYPRINEAIHNGENVRSLIVNTTLAMAATGALPYLTIAIAGPILFEFVFGNGWHIAGIYAQLLSAWLFLQYVNKPAIAAIPALRLQGGLLIYEIFSTSSKLMALWLGFIYFENDLIAIALFSFFGVLAYLWLILWVIRSSSKVSKEQNKDATL